MRTLLCALSPHFVLLPLVPLEPRVSCLLAFYSYFPLPLGLVTIVTEGPATKHERSLQLILLAIAAYRWSILAHIWVYVKQTSRLCSSGNHKFVVH